MRRGEARADQFISTSIGRADEVQQTRAELHDTVEHRLVSGLVGFTGLQTLPVNRIADRDGMHAGKQDHTHVGQSYLPARSKRLSIEVCCVCSHLVAQYAAPLGYVVADHPTHRRLNQPGKKKTVTTSGDLILSNKDSKNSGQIV